jgi:hypothetical protein
MTKQAFMQKMDYLFLTNKKYSLLCSFVLGGGNAVMNVGFFSMIGADYENGSTYKTNADTSIR